MLFLLLALPASAALHLSFILLYKSAVCELQSEEKIKQDRQKDKPAHYVLCLFIQTGVRNAMKDKSGNFSMHHMYS